MNVAELTAGLSAADPTARARAAEQLARLEDGAGDAATALVRAMGDDSEEVRQWASAALESLGPPPAAQTLSLADLLHHPHADVGYWSATLLGRLGPEARAAIPKLALVLGGKASVEVRVRCAWAMGKIGIAEGADDALQQAATSAEPRLARIVRQALDQIKGR